MQVLLGPVNQTMYHTPGCPMVFSGQSPSSPVQQHTLQVSQWHSAAVWLGGQPITKTSTIYWQSLSKCVWLCGQHLSQPSCSLPLAAGTVTVWAAQVHISLLKCLLTMGPTLGAKFLPQVFLSFTPGEAQALGPWGYKTLRL